MFSWTLLAQQWFYELCAVGECRKAPYILTKPRDRANSPRTSSHTYVRTFKPGLFHRPRPSQHAVLEPLTLKQSVDCDAHSAFPRLPSLELLSRDKACLHEPHAIMVGSADVEGPGHAHCRVPPLVIYVYFRIRRMYTWCDQPNAVSQAATEKKTVDWFPMYSTILRGLRVRSLRQGKLPCAAPIYP